MGNSTCKISSSSSSKKNLRSSWDTNIVVVDPITLIKKHIHRPNDFPQSIVNRKESGKIYILRKSQQMAMVVVDLAGESTDSTIVGAQIQIVFTGKEGLELMYVQNRIISDKKNFISVDEVSRLEYPSEIIDYEETEIEDHLLLNEKERMKKDIYQCKHLSRVQKWYYHIAAIQLEGWVTEFVISHGKENSSTCNSQTFTQFICNKLSRNNINCNWPATVPVFGNQSLSRILYLEMDE
ncbi:hypothetical protein DFA_08056 [Cavenderia fasciculata]|uniref:Uncharacterized protein n=1 Tax=Cavenderia fasciculata TaxID=261658 RepID=F4Q4W8_CACFS|nr:uncharacterized protein DFA_08056 [Cavenderia fasciculata]EGG17074.1 hypothetical protein DFA_08056 [Cavenderia fasciculata]|eukprot:XP_004355558.1 hypothetical protein DFA_08056 [Cavenderia fasciculata]